MLQAVSRLLLVVLIYRLAKIGKQIQFSVSERLS